MLLADGVVASSVVVRGVLLPRDQLLGVEQLPIGASTDLRQGQDSEHMEARKTTTSSTTVGSRSTKTALGTCFPLPVVEKNVENESSAASSWYS